MLEDCLLESRPAARSKNRFTVVLSVVTHSVIVAALILIPLFQEQVLPQVQIALPLRPPQAMDSVRLVPPEKGGGTSTPAPRSNDLIAPAIIPARIEFIVDAPEASVVGFMPADGNNPGTSSFFGDPRFTLGAQAAPPPPPPPRVSPPPAPPAPAPQPVPQAPVRKGGEVVKSNLIHQVTPVYPFLAKQARVEGVVTLEAVITREGAIDSLRVVSGHILLNEAAVEAVKQWRYRPTLLNGQPVEVITNIWVTFRLN